MTCKVISFILLKFLCSKVPLIPMKSNEEEIQMACKLIHCSIFLYPSAFILLKQKIKEILTTQHVIPTKEEKEEF